VVPETWCSVGSTPTRAIPLPPGGVPHGGL